MAFTNLTEILNLFILIIAIAFILSGYIKNPYKRKRTKKFLDWDDFKFAAAIAVPAILFHELAHKFVAIGFGAEAIFEIFPLGLLIGVILKLVGSPFLLLAPGYVSIPASAVLTQAQLGLIAFAGPLINLIFWLTPAFILKAKRNMDKRKATFLFYTSFINMWLFIFNMIPLPPFDGSKVFGAIISLFN